MPKQNPVNPYPPMAPSIESVKPYSAFQLSKMPPRIAKPTPAARIAVKPAHNNRFSFPISQILPLKRDRRAQTVLVMPPDVREIMGCEPMRVNHIFRSAAGY